MAVDPADFDMRQSHCPAQDFRRLPGGDPELVLLQAGGDVCVPSRIDVEVDAEENARFLLLSPRDPVQDIDFLRRLDVERMDARPKGGDQLVVPLSDAAERDFRCVNPRREGNVQFPDRGHVRAETLLADEAQERPVGVGLDGVEGHVRMAVERPLDVTAVIEHRALAVDIERRAELLRHVTKGNGFRHKRRISVREFLHQSAARVRECLFPGPAGRGNIGAFFS